MASQIINDEDFTRLMGESSNQPSKPPLSTGGLSDSDFTDMMEGVIPPDDAPVLPDPLDANLPESVRQASNVNPDTIAETRKLAKELDVPESVVHGDMDRARKEKRVKDVDLPTLRDTAPVTAQWVSDQRNADIALDDVDILSGLEVNINTRKSRRGYWNNQGRLFVDTMSKIGTEGAAGAAWGLEMAKVLPDIASDFIYETITGEEGSAREGTKELVDGIRNFLDEREQSSTQFYGGEQRADIKKVIESPTPGNIGEFIAEAGPSSIPYMIAAGISYPLIVSVVGNMVAEERVKNDNRTGLPTDADMGIGMGTSMLTGLIERFSLGKLLRSGTSPKMIKGVKEGLVKYAAAEVAKGGAREAGTEFVQEGMEAIGGSIGTEKGVNAQDVYEQALSGGLVGFGMGTSLRTATVYPEYNQKIYETAVREQFNRLESSEAQDWLDDHIALAQSSATGPRDPETFKNFLDTVDPEARVFISAEAAAELITPPQYIQDQLDDTGADVTMSMREFLTDIAIDEEKLAIVRPHIKIHEDLQTLTDLEANVDDSQVKRLIEKAEKHQKVKDEADTMYEQVKGQIIQTHRQGEHTASLSAQLIPAYITTKYVELTARGIETTVQELYEDMGLKVIGPKGSPTTDGDTKVLDQNLTPAAKEELEYLMEGLEDPDMGVAFSDLLDQIDEGRSELSRADIKSVRLAAIEKGLYREISEEEIANTSSMGGGTKKYDFTVAGKKYVYQDPQSDGGTEDLEIGDIILDQQDFGDITMESTVEDEGGNIHKVSEKAQAVWDDTQSRLDMVERLRECLTS